MTITKEALKKIVEPKPKVIGKLSVEEAGNFKLSKMRRAALKEASESYANRLQAMAEGFVKLEADTWDTIGKRLKLDLDKNIYTVDYKTGKICFIETQADADLRKDANPLMRLLAQVKGH